MEVIENMKKEFYDERQNYQLQLKSLTEQIYQMNSMI